MAYKRTPVRIFQLGNSLYANAIVTFYAIDGSGNPTNTPITLYTASTGSTQAANPQTLDSNGKLTAAVWFQDPFVAKIGNAPVPNHQTAPWYPDPGGYQGDWLTGTAYFIGDEVRDPGTGQLYICAIAHTSGTFATDVANGDWTLLLNGTGSTPLPVTIADGGTGSTSASAARTALAVLGTANNLSDLANASTARTNLGLGTSATHAATDFLLAANNLSDVTAATARTNLGLAIGTNVEAWDADLDALAALASTGIIARTAANTYALRTITGTASDISVSNGDGVSGNPTLDLINTAVTPGSYTATNLTVDAKGRITAASNGSAGALTLLATLTASNSAALQDTTHITNAYNAYLIVFENLLPASGTPAFQIAFSTDGGSTWLATGYSGLNSVYIGLADLQASLAGAGMTEAGISATATLGGLSGAVLFTNPNNTGGGNSVSGLVNFGNSTSLHAAGVIAGSNSTTSVINGIRFKLGSSINIASGVAKIFGVS